MKIHSNDDYDINVKIKIIYTTIFINLVFSKVYYASFSIPLYTSAEDCTYLPTWTHMEDPLKPTS